MCFHFKKKYTGLFAVPICFFGVFSFFFALFGFSSFYHFLSLFLLCVCAYTFIRNIYSPIVSQLKKFWKEAPFLRYEPYDETVIGNDMFGIKIDSKLNRAKFVPDTMVCQSLLSTFLIVNARSFRRKSHCFRFVVVSFFTFFYFSFFRPFFGSLCEPNNIAFDTHLPMFFQMNSMRAHLIDTGETVDIELRKLQKLPDDIKSLPATAFRCKINQVNCILFNFDNMTDAPLYRSILGTRIN